MSSNTKNTRKTGPDLSFEEIREHLFGERSDKIQQKIDSDDFYSAAFEGLKSIENEDSLDHIMHGVERSVSKASGFKTQKEITSQRKRWMIAASVTFGLILIGSLILLNMNGSSDSRLSENNVNTENNKSINAIPGNEGENKAGYEKEIKEEVVSSQNMTGEKENAISTGQEKSDEVSSFSSPVSESRVRSESPGEEIEIIPQSGGTDNMTGSVSTDLEDKNQSLGDEDYYTNAGNDQDETAEMQDIETESPSSFSRNTAPAAVSEEAVVLDKKINNSVSVESAMDLYNNGDYQKAAEQFTSVLEESPENRKANYYAAVSFMNLGKGSDAIRHFDKLIHSSGTTYTDSSKWLKARILLNQNKKKEATELLNDLVRKENRYTQQAKELLESL